MHILRARRIKDGGRVVHVCVGRGNSSHDELEAHHTPGGWCHLKDLPFSSRESLFVSESSSTELETRDSVTQGAAAGTNPEP